MKSGRLHYLPKQEKGGRVKGLAKTGNKVPIPLRASRQGGNVNKPVSAKNRLNMVKIVKLSKLYDLNPRRQYGAMRDLARRGKIDPTALYMTNNGIFRINQKKIIRLRDADETAVKAITEEQMMKTFVTVSRRLLNNV